MTMGDQALEFALAFQKDQLGGEFPRAARFFFAAGFAPPGGGPDALLVQGTTPLHAVNEVSTPEEALATPQAALREENLRYNFPKYLASGARIVLGTDAGVSQKYAYGFAEHHEIGMYVKLGMKPADAIQVSTSRPTEVLGIKDAGTLTKGKRADFVVLNANPLEDIRNTREIDSVYLEGVRLDRDALRTKFKEAQR
jgi:imidazolonepropionase-like amidohydrolase